MAAPHQRAEIKRVLEETRTERTRVRELVNQGRWRDAEWDRNRALAYDTARTPAAGAEAIIGKTDDLQQVVFLFEGGRIRRSVAFVETSNPRSTKTGTGFLVSPRLFLTNQHVIENLDDARSTQITFDREALGSGRPSKTSSYLLDPEAFALFSDSADLDYALIAVGERNGGDAALTDLGYCIISDTPDRHRVGMNVNIIQHPNGLPKMIAIRNNLLTYRTDRTLLYETDTDHGSSGSPVFNDAWELIALHHWSFPFLEKTDENGTAFPTSVNEGVRISAIFTDLRSRLATLPAEQRALLAEALSYSAQQANANTGPTLAGPRPAPGGGEASLTPVQGAAPQAAAAQGAAPQVSVLQGSPRGKINPMPSDNSITVTIPIEVTVRVGGQTSVAAPALTGATPKVLQRGAEVLTVDEDYASRTGYAPNFIPGVEIPLPTPSEALAKQIAPLRASEANSASGVLLYEHFSVVMNKSKRLAMFTATNIDGKTYLNVDRGTGQAGGEADKWFKDPRISESFWTGQDFYSEWSTYFDRGHLTRRTDPSWGTEEEAERANVDTFHFTNCSPQHYRFNQTTKFWQGAERYVLENGELKQDERKPITVFQGPIFDSAIDLYAGELQIPSSFFKIIVWQGQERLKAVGLIVDQLALLSEPRRNLGQPTSVASVDVNHWRVSIATIEKRSKLDFGDAVRNADTINSVAQPDVGGEAAVLVKSFADLLK